MASRERKVRVDRERLLVIHDALVRCFDIVAGETAISSDDRGDLVLVWMVALVAVTDAPVEVNC